MPGSPGGSGWPSTSTTLISTPGSGQPSVLNERSSSSSSRVSVTAPFSVMPQAETIFAPSAFRACSTNGPGMGAPAHKKVRRLGTATPVSVTVRARSVRNGVEAMVKLAFSALMSAMALPGSHTSCSTALACSRMGMMSPYMKPVWCAMGEAIRITSSAPRCRRSAYGTILAITVLAECITPLGSPVVPEV